MNLSAIQINYGLIKEKNSIIVLYKNYYLHHNDVLMYSTYSEGESVVAEKLKLWRVRYIKKWQLMIINLNLVI